MNLKPVIILGAPRSGKYVKGYSLSTSRFNYMDCDEINPIWKYITILNLMN